MLLPFSQLHIAMTAPARYPERQGTAGEGAGDPERRRVAFPARGLPTRRRTPSAHGTTDGRYLRWDSPSPAPEQTASQAERVIALNGALTKPLCLMATYG